MKKLYVGNLAWAVTDEDLQTLFSEHGSVASASVITDRETGRSRGFGFVEIEDGAEAAIEALNGLDFKGRALRVNEAQSKQRPGGGGGAVVTVVVADVVSKIDSAIAGIAFCSDQ